MDDLKLQKSQNDFDNRLRMKTQMSILEDAIPDSDSLLGFQNKPPRLLWTYLFACLASIDIMINIPTLYDACIDATNDSNYYMYIFSIYMCCEFLGSLAFAFWLDRRPITEILTVSGLLLCIGNMLYTHGVGKKMASLMIIGRGICGIAGSIQIIGYAHVTRYSDTLDSRESRVVYFRFVTALGAITGPLLGVIVSGGSINMGFWEINRNNSGSFTVMCLSLCYLLALIVWMILEYRRKKKGNNSGQISTMLERSDSREDRFQKQYEKSTFRASFHLLPHRFLGKDAFLLWFLYTSAVFSFWSFEGAILPVGKSETDWSTRALYSLFVFIGIIFLLAFVLNRYVIEWFKISKEKRVIASLLLMIIGSFFLTPLGINNDNNNIPIWQIIIACPFLTCGFCIATIQIPALYCKLVGAEMGDLGIRMSWFFALASFGQVLGPIYGYLMIKKWGSVNFVSHTSGFLLISATLIALSAIHANSTLNNDQNKNKPQREEDMETGLLNERL